MDIKKILALTIIALALFSCMSAASAGLFDFFGGGEVKNQTYTFEGFTLDFPETANVTVTNETDDGVQRQLFTIRMQNESDSSKTYTSTVVISKGQNIVSSINEYVSNMVNAGGKEEGTYGEWTVINIGGIPISQGSLANFTGYVLAKHTGEKLILIRGNDLPTLKHLADTYKEV